MALHLVHFNTDNNRNSNGLNAVIVEAADVAAALIAAKAAMPDGGGKVTDTWSVQLLSALAPPLLIEGNIIPPGRRRGV